MADSPLLPAAADSPDDVFALRSAAVCRGIGRLFARNGIWALPEMPLRNGRRADLMGIDAKGQVVIVEVKTARADLLGDGKWPDYLDFCDRFYWGLPPELDRQVLDGPDFRPDFCGVIVADEYDAEIVRPAPSHPLASARRRVEVERLARTALRRLLVAGDPHCQGWGRDLAG
ncbi:MAG: MmcB family DNA repair protein [Erythrobacter sp.]|nr:MmcB family DNA repair protein [Erythrobacter sp.]